MPDTLIYHVGNLGDTLYDRLTQQVTRALNYEATRCQPVSPQQRDCETVAGNDDPANIAPYRFRQSRRHSAVGANASCNRGAIRSLAGSLTGRRRKAFREALLGCSI